MTLESPARQVAGFIAKFDPKVAKAIRASRAALRKRFPTANELVYDNYNFFVIGFSATERSSDCVGCHGSGQLRPLILKVAHDGFARLVDNLCHSSWHNPTEAALRRRSGPLPDQRRSDAGCFDPPRHFILSRRRLGTYAANTSPSLNRRTSFTPTTPRGTDQLDRRCFKRA